MIGVTSYEFARRYDDTGSDRSQSWEPKVGNTVGMAITLEPG